jgi:hypothetical protein
MELAQHDWTTYFRSITSEPQRLLVAFESVGRRTPVEERIDAMCEGVCTRHPLRAIGYEQHSDVFEVAVGLSVQQGPLLRFFVAAPRRICVRDASAARAFVITDAGGARTLVCVFSMHPWETRTATLTRRARSDPRPRRKPPAALHRGTLGRSGRAGRSTQPLTLARPALECATPLHRRS